MCIFQRIFILPTSPCLQFPIHYLNTSVGTSDILKFALYSNQYYIRNKIYWKFIHVKDIPCHVSGMTSGFSRLGKYRELLELPLAVTSIK